MIIALAPVAGARYLAILYEAVLYTLCNCTAYPETLNSMRIKEIGESHDTDSRLILMSYCGTNCPAGGLGF